jgi:hypothetical protein
VLIKEYNDSSTIALLALQFLSVVYSTCRSSLVVIGIHYIVFWRYISGYETDFR